VSGEHEYAVPPLSREEALALFAERAQAAKATFNLNGNRPVVAEICRRLDHLPLAIELAAARIKLLPEKALLERLDQKLKLLTGGARDLDERQRTLRAAIEWSYNLLSDEEQTLFRRLAVFVGGRALEAIEAICNPDGELDVFEGIASLVDKSLLRQEETEDGEPRFVMLETIHEYAREKLDESHEGWALRERHARHFAERFQTQHALVREGVELLRQLDADHENLRAALRHLLDAGEAESVASLIDSVWAFWMMRGLLEEGRRWTDAALKRSAILAPAVRAHLLATQGEFLRFQGRFDEAIASKNEAAAAARDLGDRPLLAATLHDLGEVYLQLRDHERSRQFHEEALSLRQEDGSRLGIAHALIGLADLALVEGDLARARTLYEQILDAGRESGELDFEAGALISLGDIARREGDSALASRLIHDGLSVASRLGSVFRLLQGVVALTLLAWTQAQPQRAATLLGASDQLREQSGYQVLAEFDTDAQLSEIRAHVQSAGLEHAFAEGRAMTLDEAVAYALVPENRPSHTTSA
jgi:tetratricopeptide (TPR) repeat protein